MPGPSLGTIYFKGKIMKKLIILIMIVVMVNGITLGGASGYNLGAVNSRITSDWFSDGGIKDVGTNALRNIEILASFSSNPGTGKVWYVDSNVSNEGDGSSWLNAKDTVNEVVVLSDADGGDDRGDVFMVAQGHAESGIVADLVDITVSGSTLVHLGNTTNQGTYTFSHADTTFAIGASEVRIIGGNYVAGITSITMGISLEAAADNCVFDSMVFPKPTTNSWEFVDTFDVADGANNVTIVNCIGYNDEAGAAAAHFIDAGNGSAGPTNLYVVNNIIKGDFTVSAIWSDEPCDEAYIAYNTIINHESGAHCIEFTDAGTGAIKWNDCFGDTEGSIIDPGSMSEFGNIKSIAVDTPGYPGWILESALDHFLNLDGATQVYPENAVDDSIIAKILTKSDPANISDYNNATDSLEAIGDNVIAAIAAQSTFASANYLAVSTGVFDTTGVWSTVASHEIATVTGLVRMLIVPECTVSVGSVSDTGTIELEDETTTESIIAASTLGSGTMVANELWVDATLTRTILTRTQLNAIEIVVSDLDIGYEVKTNALDEGTIVFHIFWTPLSSTGLVVAGAGGTL